MRCGSRPVLVLVQVLALALAQALAQAAQAVQGDVRDTPPAMDDQLTCFTCSNVTDNDHCNRYAIDRPCEPGLTLCRTDHVVERVPQSQRGTTRSVRVTKECVSPSECSRAAVGCRSAGHLKVCTSCCDWSYCNELAPSDSVSAVLALSRGGAGTGVAVRSGAALPTILILWAARTL